VPERLEVELGGVPETLLWTLYHRAVEARRPDAVRPRAGFVVPLLSRMPALRRATLTVHAMRFG
jgi:hypothetical protein